MNKVFYHDEYYVNHALIEKAFKDSGKTIRAVADEAGLSFATVSAILHNYTNLNRSSLPVAYAFCNALCLNIKDILDTRVAGQIRANEKI